MKLKDIHIRDPFILNENGTYYLYGTRGPTCWGEQDGIDGYTSQDLENWEGPFEVFHKPEGFRADRCYWAPEVHVYKGAYYMFATFDNSVIRKKGTMILKADTPLGPYQIHSEGKATPENWNCLDGTFYISKDGRPYMIFCHEWRDLVDGDMCYVELSEDLKRAVSEPVKVFSATDAEPWVRPEPNIKPGNFYITDGPFMYRKKNGELLMLWASFGENGYVEALARSDNGEIDGKWTIDPVPLFDQDGGHGMIFADQEGKEYLVLHQPNNHPNERPVLIPLDLNTV